MSKPSDISGLGSIVVSIFLWGILPFYWKQLDHIPSDVLIAHRILWSFVFVFFVLVFTKGIPGLVQQIKSKRIWPLFLSGFIISLNWYTYVYSVNSDQIIEASLGYYINPLLTILIGKVFLKEKMSYLQVIAVLLAALGVCVITLSFGSIPILSLILAITFSTYTLMKKTITVSAANGLAIETMPLVPISIVYLVYNQIHSNEQLITSNADGLLILGTGMITAIPLLLYSYGTRRVPLTTIGFIQYLSPTISLLLGVFYYKELFSYIHIVTFVLIWLALILYSISQISNWSMKTSSSK